MSKKDQRKCSLLPLSLCLCKHNLFIVGSIVRGFLPIRRRKIMRFERWVSYCLVNCKILQWKMEETLSQLYRRFKKIFNGLHTIENDVENRDLIEYIQRYFFGLLWSYSWWMSIRCLCNCLVKLDELRRENLNE